MHLCAGDNAAADKLQAFIEAHRVKILNVAGPRASKEPGVGELVMSTLEEVLARLPKQITAAQHFRSRPRRPAVAQGYGGQAVLVLEFRG